VLSRALGNIGGAAAVKAAVFAAQHIKVKHVLILYQIMGGVSLGALRHDFENPLPVRSAMVRIAQ
jgi:hypothetical protein